LCVLAALALAAGAHAQGPVRVPWPVQSTSTVWRPIEEMCPPGSCRGYDETVAAYREVEEGDSCSGRERGTCGDLRVVIGQGRVLGRTLFFFDAAGDVVGVSAPALPIAYGEVPACTPVIEEDLCAHPTIVPWHPWRAFGEAIRPREPAFRACLSDIAPRVSFSVTLRSSGELVEAHVDTEGVPRRVRKCVLRGLRGLHSHAFSGGDFTFRDGVALPPGP
jgi:hypothetical protein